MTTIKSNRTNQTATKIIKTVIDNTKEHLTDTDKKLLHNNAVLEGILRDFNMNQPVKSAFETIIKNNNNIISSNALFKAVEIVPTTSIITKNEDDCN